MADSGDPGADVLVILRRLARLVFAPVELLLGAVARTDPVPEVPDCPRTSHGALAPSHAHGTLDSLDRDAK